MNRQPIKGAPAIFAAILPDVIEIAKQCGYAIAVHGSMTHDMDLIAVPWMYNALPTSILIERIREHVKGHIDLEGTTIMSPSPEKKVHGRMAWSIYLRPDFTGPYIDISVTPRINRETGTVMGIEETS